MKIFYSESLPDYASYTFNYGIYCLKESNEELSQILSKGFLPYSGNIHLSKDIFYLARSLRLNAQHYKETSENRRVQRKVAHLDLHFNTYRKEDFDRNPQFDHFCQNYARERMGGNMPPERFDFVYKNSTCTHITEFTSMEKTIGYLLSAQGEEFLQYWFSFFDLALMKEVPIGKWMMWKMIAHAVEQGKEHIYLGTCYGTKSLYKVRDFKGLEFFDGYGWSSDLTALKSKCKSDDQRGSADDLKAAEDMNQYLEALLDL